MKIQLGNLNWIFYFKREVIDITVIGRTDVYAVLAALSIDLTGRMECMKNNYTGKKLQIMQTTPPMDITDEEFLFLFNKAFRENDFEFIVQLELLYPEIMDRTSSFEFMEKNSNPADDEGNYVHPILCPTNRCTEGRIKDMVCYLTGGTNWPDLLLKQLQNKVAYKLVFNYLIDDYVKDYDPDELWHLFFCGHAKLFHVMQLRGITGLDILIFRAMEYFEK